MVTGQLSAELSATCSNLGHHDGLTYHIDPYCRESVKDLIRYLRKDDDDHSIRRYLGSSKILQTDLVPILIHHSQNQELFDVVLRLLMNLTTPALIVYQEQIPTDKTERNHYLQIISHLQDYKQAFVKPEIWEVLAKKISELLEMEYIERDEDVNRMMERILILARNVLAVPSDSEYEKRPDNDATIHDKVLWAIHESNLAEIFLYVASSDKEQHVYMHILEIVSLMLREQKPSVLAKSAIQRSFVEKEKDEEELLAFRQAEIKSKQMKVKKYAGSRHGNFGGTYVMKGIKAAGDKDLIFHKPLEKAMSLDFNFEKKRIKKPKNLRPLKYFSEERRSTFGVRLYLKEFCIDFLNGAYNSLMKRVKEIIERGKSQGDESYYFWAMRFFMEFNRNHNFQVKLVSETVSVETFHFVQTQLQEWNDLMVTDKKKIPLWSRRMHIALNAYQELLLTLIEMDKSPDDNVRKSSQILKSRVFYVTEYRDLLVILLHVFKENRFSRCYLKDLIETIHIFMKMLEKYCTKHRGLVVEKKKKFVHKKKKSGKGKSQQSVNLESIWDQIGPQLSVVLQGNENIPTDIVPFDAASDLDMDQQKVEAMKRIQSLLKNGDIEESIGLLRSAREVWPENDSFGSATLTPEEEYSAMQEIFMADLGQPGAARLPGGNHLDDDEEEDEEEAYEASQNVQIREQDFTFKDFVNRFVTNKTMEACGMLLSEFEKNTPHTNHCIVKLLHRISWDQGMPAMVFQASIFRVFQRVLESRNAEHKELQKFAKFIVQKFIEVSKRNPKVFIELLFWKKVKDSVEIVEGYGSYAGNKTQSAKNIWTEEQEDEIRRLHEEYLRENPGSNMVDWIMQNLINQERSRISVIKKLKKLGLASKNDFSSLTKRSSREWTSEEEQLLRELVPQFLEAENPIECIMLRFTGKRIKKHIVQKCLDLGLIFDKKQLYKKKSRRQRKPKETQDSSDRINSEGSADSDGNSIIDSESSDDDFPQSSNRSEKNFDKTHSVDDIINLLNRYVEAGNYKEPLEWLKSSLLDTIEDIDEDETDVPLLPISGECVKAMEDRLYLDFLEAIGIKRPSNEQEVYWRIPGSWKESDLRSKAKMIEDALDGKLVVPTEGDNRPEEIPKLKVNRKKKSLKERYSFKNVLINMERDNASNSDSSSSEEDNHTSVRASKSSRRKIGNSDSEDSLSHNNSPSTSHNNSRNVVYSDSDSNEIRGDNTKNFKEVPKEQHKHKKRLIAVFDSESDSDQETTKGPKKSELEKEKRHIANSANEEGKENISSHANLEDSNKNNDANKLVFSNDNDDSQEITLTDKLVQNIEYSSTKRKRVISSDSSDSESDSGKNLGDNNLSDKSFTEVKSTQNHKRRAVIESDSEDDIVVSGTLKINHNNESSQISQNNIDSKLITDNSKEMTDLMQSKSDDLNLKFVNQSPEQFTKIPKRKKAVIDSSSDDD